MRPRGPVSQPEPGLMITPNVRLTRPLNEGGMGSVWVAEHLALRTEVVVKFITGDLAKNPEAVARFEREAAAASQVKSPHVVQTFDHGLTADGMPYIVMELLEGEELGDYLDKHRRMPPKDVVSLVTQLGRALDKAHAKGIVHRDIKPNNIFLTGGEGGEGEFFVKLLDFGIAKGADMPRIDSATRTGAVMGSPFYMSPEQIVGAKEIGPRSDLWAVGVVAFEALTGARPFEAETMGALAIQIHGGPLPKPTEKAPDLPASVDTWFEKACARDPADRFPSAKELADGLARALSEASSSSLPPSTGPRSVPFSDDMFAKTAEVTTPFGKEIGREVLREVEASTHGLASSTSVAPPKARTGTILAGGGAVLLIAGLAIFALGRSTSTTGTTPTPSVQSAVISAPSLSSMVTPPVPSSGLALVPLPSSTASLAASASASARPGTGGGHGPKPHASTAPSTPTTAPPHPTATSNDPLY